MLAGAVFGLTKSNDASHELRRSTDAAFCTNEADFLALEKWSCF
jgi:hypothetical protein